jgi:HK97 gp10 family phage protein
MAQPGIRIEGLEELRELLNVMAPRAATNLLRAAVQGVAADIAAKARKNAPVRTGTLRKAIKAKRGNPKDNRGMPFSDVIVEHGKNAKHDAFYWHFVEHGTKGGVKKQRFLGRALEEMRPQVPKLMREQVGVRLEKMLARAAKKAAK